MAEASDDRKPVIAVKKRTAKPAVVEVAVPPVKQPFKMSYDGTNDRDYIAHRLRLGAR